MQDREIISAIRQIRRSQIEELLTEWDQISRDAFLKKYNVFPAQKFWLVHNGKTYDAKAVLVPALRKSNPLFANLSANSFSGTNATVAQPLRDLGFSIEEYADQPRYWWVNQNQTFDEEVGGGFMWSPKMNSNGARNQSYDNMELVRPGDIVFSFCDTRIKAIGRVTAAAQTQVRPEFRTDSWSASPDGWFVETDFVELSNQLRPKDHIERIRDHLPAKYSPLQQNGNGVQSVYLASVPESMAAVLVELIGPEANEKQTQLAELENLLERPKDRLDAQVTERTDIGAVEQIRLLRSRRGQGVFKRNVMIYEGACRVTRVADIRHLRASHIKPWSVSTDEEKLSGSNGLLLSPHIDHLFDQGWISFGEREEILVSPSLTPGLTKAWGIDLDHKIGRFSPEQSEFLEFHRSEIFRA